MPVIPALRRVHTAAPLKLSNARAGLDREVALRRVHTAAPLKLLLELGSMAVSAALRRVHTAAPLKQPTREQLSARLAHSAVFTRRLR